MAVYVDPLRRTVAKDAATRRVGARHDHLWCHMFADSEDELHELARKIGLKRSWFQNHRLLPHYDLTPARREAAVRAGAVEVDWQGLVDAIRAAQLR